MAKIKIMTDSACDIPKEKEHELNIRILNFPITIEEKGYREREDFETQEFYEVLRKSLPMRRLHQLNLKKLTKNTMTKVIQI